MSVELFNSELKIAGFGACMISGYPHKANGMFETACGLIERELSRPVQSTIVSLHSFPAPRAEKYLKRRVVDFNPDYIVIQFGSTDATCPIRQVHRAALTQNRNSSSLPVLRSRHLGQPSTVLDRCRWELTSVIGYLTKPAPITPVAAYTAAIERMVKGCRAAGAVPVVLSPFVYGSRYTTTNAFAYTSALHDLAKSEDLILVDCITILKPQSRRRILEHDGFHLSLLGHELVGQAIAQSIVADLRKRVGMHHSERD